ncbi:hypothetical protein BJY52DRAFT_1230243 [Lactarius psammicola]|nr:hypothetical protein BJY52DRAFT_1230243 [Lactarius psammicola]
MHPDDICGCMANTERVRTVDEMPHTKTQSRNPRENEKQNTEGRVNVRVRTVLKRKQHEDCEKGSNTGKSARQLQASVKHKQHWKVEKTKTGLLSVVGGVKWGWKEREVERHTQPGAHKLKLHSIKTVSFGEALPIRANAQAHSIELQASAKHNTGRWREKKKLNCSQSLEEPRVHGRSNDKTVQYKRAPTRSWGLTYSGWSLSEATPALVPAARVQVVSNIEHHTRSSSSSGSSLLTHTYCTMFLFGYICSLVRFAWDWVCSVAIEPLEDWGPARRNLCFCATQDRLRNGGDRRPGVATGATGAPSLSRGVIAVQGGEVKVEQV